MMSESLVYIIEANQVQDFTEYSIEVHHGGFIWTVKHRYSEFKEMHDMLRAKYPDLVEKNLLPPKKLFGKMSATFIDKRRIELEAYLQAVLNKKYSHGIPRPLRQFLHFQYYEVEMLCQILAKLLFETGDSVLLSGSAYTFTPLQLWAITERLQQEKPPTDTEDPKFDFGHVLDFVQKLKHLHIKCEKGRVGTSNIVTEMLTFDLSVFHSLQQVVVDGCSASQVRCLSNLRYSVSSIGIHQSLTNLRSLLTEGYDTDDPQLTWRRLINADFSDNAIFSIDSSVKLLVCVEFLDLSLNKISKIENLENLSSLTFIDLSHNLIDEFDVAHARLGNVKTLILSDNKLRTLRGLGKLYSLEVLDISKNFIAEISEVDHISKLPCLCKLNLWRNAITDDYDYRPQTLSRFGSRACEICLDQVPSTQKELDTSAVLYAILKTLENMAMSAPGHLQTMPSSPSPQRDGFVPEKHKPLKTSNLPERRQLTNLDMSGHIKTSSLPEKPSRDGISYGALEEPSQQTDNSAPVRDHSMEIRIIDPHGESVSEGPSGQDSSYKTLDDDGAEEVPSVYHSAFSSPVIFPDKEGLDADSSLGASFIDVQSSSPRVPDDCKHQESNAQASNSAQLLKGADTPPLRAESSASYSPQSNERQRFSSDIDISGPEKIAQTENGLGISSGWTRGEEARFWELYQEFKAMFLPTSFDPKMSEDQLFTNKDVKEGEIIYDEEVVRGSCSLKSMPCFWSYGEDQQDKSNVISDASITNNSKADIRTPSAPEQKSAPSVEILASLSRHEQQSAMLNYEFSKEGKLSEWQKFLSVFYETSFEESVKPKAQEFVNLLEKSSLPRVAFTESPALLSTTDADASIEDPSNRSSPTEELYSKSEEGEKLLMKSDDGPASLHEGVVIEESLLVDVVSEFKQFAPSKVDGVLTTDACPQEDDLETEFKYTDNDLSLMEKGDPPFCDSLSEHADDQDPTTTKEQKNVLLFQNEILEETVDEIISKCFETSERKGELEKDESCHENKSHMISETRYNVETTNTSTKLTSSSFDPSITTQEVESSSLFVYVIPEECSDIAERKIEVSSEDFPESEHVMSSSPGTEDVARTKHEGKAASHKNTEMKEQALSFPLRDNIKKSNPDSSCSISSQNEKQIIPQNHEEKSVQFSQTEPDEATPIGKLNITHRGVDPIINQHVDGAEYHHCGAQCDNKSEGPSCSSTFESSSGINPFSSLTDAATSHSIPKVGKDHDQEARIGGSEDTKGPHTVKKALRFGDDQNIHFPAICEGLVTIVQESQTSAPTETIVKLLSQSEPLSLCSESISCSSSSPGINCKPHEDLNIQSVNAKSNDPNEQSNNCSKIPEQNQAGGETRPKTKRSRRRRFSTDEDDLCVTPVMHLNFNSLSLSHLSSLSPSQYVSYQECKCFPKPNEQILYMIWSDVIFSDRPNTEVSCAVFLTNKNIHFVSDPSREEPASSYNLGAFDRLKNPTHLSHTKFSLRDENDGRLMQIVVGLYSQCVRVMGSNLGEIATLVTRSAWLTRQFLKNLFSILIDSDAFHAKAMNLLEHSESLTNETIEDSNTGLIVQLNNEEAMMEFNLLSVDSRKQQRGSANPQLILYCLAKVVDDHFRKSPITVILTTDLMCMCTEDTISYPLTNSDVSTPEFNRYRDLQTVRLADIRCLQVNFVVGYDIAIHVVPLDRACEAFKWRLEFRDYCEREKLMHAVTRQHRYICGQEIKIFVGDNCSDEENKIL